ncbi:MAG: hemerythrin domain-containing protein [Candidatus Dormibacteraeota bacterium]|uniref:Hemerythrin domain-containing protein n=1 Tax=Candidatus Amunia macphersoniae TaxID=3127014 RepID=A0A934NGK4_9BACT|nr:hemerythrin domain-containing protein [Candidatus Dormibacteraeota bacterium]
MDITEMILSDHHEQRRMFAMLEEIGDDASKLEPVWTRLAILLEVHAQAEEELFYPRLLHVGKGAGGSDSAEDETKDAIHDHNEIRDAITAARQHPVGSEEWWQGVNGANEANGDHMAEEEREGLADFRKNASLQVRHDLAVQFAAFEAAHAGGIVSRDKDPAKYVEQNED